MALTLKLLQDCVVGRKRHKEKFHSTDRFSNASASLKCCWSVDSDEGGWRWGLHSFLCITTSSWIMFIFICIERESQLCNQENEIIITTTLKKSS